jgi:Zn-dependent protease
MEQIKTIWQGLDWSVITDALISVIPALLCITLHELAHGWVAYKLGDNTAKSRGRLTLNPIKHIDIMGLIMMVAFHFGWAKPVPVNMYNFKNPKGGMALTALAGPVCNLLLTCLLLFIYGLVYLPLSRSGTLLAQTALETIATASYLSLALAVFNIIPIPPLDGSKVLFSLLNQEHYNKLMRYERYGMILLLVVVATGVLGRPLGTVTGFIYDKLFVIAEFAFDLMAKVG